MATIIINDSTFQLTGFNRSTAFTDDTISSYAYLSITYDNNASAAIHQIAEGAITSIVIKNSNNETIYTLSDINAKISNIDEILNGDVITVSVNLQFNN